MKKLVVFLCLMLLPLTVWADPFGSVPPSDEVYNAVTWDGNQQAATKNAIRDAIEALGGAGFDSTAVDATTWSDGANASNIWTFDVSGTDHTMTAGNGLMTFSHAVTVSGTITGNLTGNVSGSSGSCTGTAALATTVTVSDDESTNDAHEVAFTTDNANLESDGDFTYNPSTGTVACTVISPSTDLTVANGGTGASTLTDGGVLLGSGTDPITAMAVLADGEMIVGDGTTDPVAESGATLRTSIGVGTGDSPQFTAVELSHASANTLTGSGGNALIEGIQLARLDQVFTMGKTVTEFSNADATPDVSASATGGNNFYYTNANGTITDFDDSDDHSEFANGDWFVLRVDDASTTIDFSANANIEGNAGVDFTGSATQITYLMFVYEDSRWNCVNLQAGMNSPTALTLSSINMTGGTAEFDDIDLNDTKSIVTEKDTSDDYSAWEATDDVGDSPAQVEVVKVSNSGNAAAPTLELGGATTQTRLYLNATPDDMADDNWNGTAIKGINFGETVGQWACVFLAADGKVDIADADAAGEFPALGIVVAGGNDTDAATILVQGIVRNEGWSGLTVGGAVYLGDAGAGAVTQTAPSTSGDCVQIIGRAISDSEIYFNFTPHWLEVE